MRPRSLSVACDRAERFSKKFEGVTTDHEDDSDSDDEPEEVVVKEGFSLADYDKLVTQIRAVLPSNDTRKAEYRLKVLDWDRVAFDGYSPDTVKNIALKIMKGVRKFRTLEEVLNDVITVAKKSIVAGKPKMPLSAFNFYVKERLPAYKQENPGVTHQQAFSKVVEDYKLLSAKKKRKYEQLADGCKEAYKIQLDKFYMEHPEIAKKEPKKPRTSKPKPVNVTPFNLFREEKEQEGRKMSRADCKTAWERLDFDEKMKYVRAAYSSEKSKLTKDEMGMIATSFGKPEFVPRTLFEYYVKNHVDKDNTISVLTWRKEAALQLKRLPKLKKLELELEMRRARAAYVTKYQQYIDKLPLALRQSEIEFLQAYINTTDPKDKQNNKSRSMVDRTGNDEHTAHDITALPIAESTTHDIEPVPKKKSKKKETPFEPVANNVVPKPLKSILKSQAPSPIVASPKRKTAGVHAEANDTPTKKRKPETVVVESESDSNAVKGKKKAKKEKISDDRVDSSQGSLKNGTREDRQPIKEPKRPPKDILKYYKKFHYHGKDGKHKESFGKLSVMRKKSLEAEMRAAQKKYMGDLKKYLDQLPPSEVQSYVTKLKKVVSAVGNLDEADSEDASENVTANSTLGKPKREPGSSSSDDE